MLIEAFSSFLLGATNRLGMKLIDISTQSSAKESEKSDRQFATDSNPTDQEIWNIVTLYGRYKEVWSIYRTEGLLEAIKIRDEKVEFDRQADLLENLKPVSEKFVFTTRQNNSNNQSRLNDLELAIVNSTASHFKEMPNIIVKYYQDHNASREEAKVIANYYKETVNFVQNVQTKQDLQQLITHIESLTEIAKRYQHRKSKYRWYKGLERILTKLKSV